MALIGDYSHPLGDDYSDLSLLVSLAVQSSSTLLNPTTQATPLPPEPSRAHPTPVGELWQASADSLDGAASQPDLF